MSSKVDTRNGTQPKINKPSSGFLRSPKSNLIPDGLEYPLAMKPGHRCILPLSIALLLWAGCKDKPHVFPETSIKDFASYWDTGEAEITGYEATLNIHNSTYTGTSLLICDTEDFSRSKHVKLEAPEKHKADVIRVMKLHTLSEWITGLYKHSAMNSVYTPVDVTAEPHSLKLTSTVQEWNGQTFIQADWKNNRYDFQQMSYTEPDRAGQYSLAMGWLEDEVWTKIRLAPNSLPIGKMKMIPGMLYLRYHATVENKMYEANANLTKTGDHYTYIIEYPELDRKLSIAFESNFPYHILGWQETVNGKDFTNGKRINTIRSAFWKHDQLSDQVLRKELGLQ